VSLYRQPGRVSTRTLVLSAVGALALGLIGGFVLGHVTAPDPTLADKVADLRTELKPASEGLELTATEYGQAVRNGQVAEPTEYSAAQSDLQRVRAAVDGAREDLRALDPTRAAAFESAVAQVEASVRAKADASEVQRRSDAARAALSELLGSG
jgi:hypothetical protein